MKHLSVDRAKRVDRSCRNHGSCPYCRRSRTRCAARRIEAAQEQVETGIEEYYGEVEDGFTNYSMNRCDESEGGAM